MRTIGIYYYILLFCNVDLPGKNTVGQRTYCPFQNHWTCFFLDQSLPTETNKFYSLKIITNLSHNVLFY